MEINIFSTKRLRFYLIPLSIGLFIIAWLLNNPAYPQTNTACIDTDGDGWGWNGTESCFLGEVVAPEEPEQAEDPVVGCLDTDGDGWGWDGEMSCIPGEDEAATTHQCVDSDGDGWGWNGKASCRVEDSGQPELDTTPPAISLLGANPLEISVGGIFTDPGATAADDIDGDISSQISISGDVVDTTQSGIYLITYDVQDVAGNHALQQSRSVVVIMIGNSGLPLDPGEAGKITIEGIDSDNDGLRDDVQRYIALEVEEEFLKDIMTQAAVALQRSIVDLDNPLNATDNSAAELAAGNCMQAHYENSIEGINRAFDKMTEIISVVINTDARSKAHFDAMMNVPTGVTGGRAKNGLEACDFPVSQ